MTVQQTVYQNRRIGDIQAGDTVRIYVAYKYHEATVVQIEDRGIYGLRITFAKPSPVGAMNFRKTDSITRIEKVEIQG